MFLISLLFDHKEIIVPVDCAFIESLATFRLEYEDDYEYEF